MSSRSRQSRALLLRSVDYRDSDRIVTLLTERKGKMSALARGARRSRRRLGGALQPYVLMQAEYRTGRGEPSHLERVSVERSFQGILQTLDALHATIAVRQRTYMAFGRWEARS